MKKSLYFVFAFITTIIAHTTTYAQAGTSAVPFLLISPNSRASGMGELGTGIADDASAIYWNPGGLAFFKGREVSISHSNWLPQFHLSDLFYEYLNYAQDVPDWNGTIAGNVTFLNLGEFVRTDDQGNELGKFKSFEFGITVGYGTEVAEDLGLGLNLRFINSSLSPIGAGEEQGKGIANTASFDIGVLYKPKKLVLPVIDEDIGGAFSVGANLSNLGPKVTYIDASQADPLPTTLRVGFGIIPVKDEFNSLTIGIDFSRLLIRKGKDLNGDGKIEGTTELGYSDPFYTALVTSWTAPTFNKVLRSINSSIGAEYWYNKLVALRMGYFYEDPKFGNRKFLTFGAGIRYDIYGFDFSYISTIEETSPLAETLRFTLLISGF